MLKERGQHGSGATAFALTYRSPLLTVELCRANRRYFQSSARHRIPHCQSKHAGASHAHGGRLWRMRRCDECWIVCAATFAGGSLWCSVARRIAPRLYVPIFQFGPLTSSTPRPWASRYSQVGSPSSPSPSPLTPFEAARGERPVPDIVSLGMLLPHYPCSAQQPVAY
jgi:hypothetical protein